MKNQLVYYPNFEPSDTNWLKLALLYFEKVTPIIPDSGDTHLSEEFRYLQDSTDLIEPLRPDYSEGDSATLDAIDQVERVLKQPERFQHIFGTPDVVAEWKSPENDGVELFGEKFSNPWADFCVENQIGRRSVHGVVVAKSMADIYMTILAHAIADSRGISPITDDRKLDGFGLFLRNKVGTNDQQQEMAIAKTILDFNLPHLESTSIEKIIRFRNSVSGTDGRRALAKALNAYLTTVEYGRDAQGFMEDLKSVRSAFSDEVVKIGSGVVGFSLGVTIAANSENFDGLRYAAQLAGGASLAASSIIAVRNAWKSTKVKRYARRYLTDLKNLEHKPSQEPKLRSLFRVFKRKR